MNVTVRSLVLLSVLGMPVVALGQGRHRAPSGPAPEASPTPQTPGAAHEGDDAAARLLYERGAEAFQAGDYETALSRFQQAYELSHRPALLYNVGTTLDRLRRDRDALAAFEQFLTEVPEHPRRTEVEARARVLRETIAEEDRQAAEAADRARQEREAADAARRQAEEEAERARQERAAAERRAAEASDGLPPAVVISVGGAAVAAGVLGIVFGLHTNKLNHDYQTLAAAYSSDLNGPQVTPDQLAQVRNAYNDAHSAQRVTNICYFSAAALAAGAVTLIFFTDWDGHGDAPTARRTTPILSAGRGGGIVGLEHRF